MHYISSYAELVQRASTAPNPTYKRFPCVTPGWDNLARRPQGARILVGATPARYQAWVEAVSPRVLDYEPDEDLVFVNAWNEWAEGNHLEPDERWGRQFLEAHKTARSRFMREQKAEPIAPGVIG
jgi:lipopolysaccharide biosynthesis protein